jgi:hypothetical protein
MDLEQEEQTMIRSSLIAAVVVALCGSTAYAQTSNGVITPPKTKSDGSIITPPAARTDPGIEKIPDKGVDQSQLPSDATPPRPATPAPTIPVPGGTGALPGSQGTDTSGPTTGNGTTR